MIINDIEQTHLRLFIEGSWVEPSSDRIDRAMRFARDVKLGTVWINTYRTASFTTPAGASTRAATANTTDSKSSESTRG